MISPTAFGSLFTTRTTPQPSQNTPEPLWAETPKLSAVGEKFPKALRRALPCGALGQLAQSSLHRVTSMEIIPGALGQLAQGSLRRVTSMEIPAWRYLHRVTSMEILAQSHQHRVGNATLCGDRRGRGAKTRGFLRFLICPRDPLRRSAWSRCKNSRFLRFLICPHDPLRGSAWSRCKSSRFFCGFFAVPRATLCGDRRGRGAKTRGFFAFFCSARATLWDRACRSALAMAPCDFVAREVAFGSCLVVCAPAFAIPQSRVRFPPGPRQLRLENRSFQVQTSYAERAPAAPAGKAQLLSTDVVCGACSHSSGWKIATSKYKRSTRSTLPQLRLENRNF